MLLSSPFSQFPSDSPFPSAPFFKQIQYKSSKAPTLSFPPALAMSVLTSQKTHTVRETLLKACRPKLSEQPSPLPALLLSLPFHSLTRLTPLSSAFHLPLALNTMSSPSSFFFFPLLLGPQQLFERTIGSAAFLFRLPFLPAFFSQVLLLNFYRL